MAQTFLMSCLEPAMKDGVVFICGAGVSAARADLPDFLKLTKRVADEIGDSSDSRAQNVLKEIEGTENIDRRTGVSGLIGLDKVFGLLEREFSHTGHRRGCLKGTTTLARCKLKSSQNAYRSCHNPRWQNTYTHHQL